MTTTVSILSTDISYGQALAFHDNKNKLHWYNKLVAFFCSIFDEAHVNNIPRRLHHPTLLIDGIVYDYSEHGLFALPESSQARYEYIELQTSEISEANKKHFLCWINSHYVLTKYKGEAYHIIYKNCITFVQEACYIMNVPFPDDLDKFLIWLAHHPWMIKIFGVRSNSSNSNNMEGKLN